MKPRTACMCRRASSPGAWLEAGVRGRRRRPSFPRNPLRTARPARPAGAGARRDPASPRLSALGRRRARRGDHDERCTRCHAEIRRRLLDPDQGRRPLAHARRRRDVGRCHPRLRTVRRGAHRRAGRRADLGPAAVRGGLSRFHGRPGCRHGTLSGHRGTDRRPRSPSARITISTSPNSSRPGSTSRSPAPRTRTDGRTGGPAPS